MKYQFIVFMIFGFILTAKGQETIPERFITEIKAQEGTWIADNSKYSEDGIERFAIEWTLSPLKNSLYGRLYGINDNIEIGTFWTFHKYFDTSKNKVVLMQIGYNGSLGIGTIEYKNNNESILTQTFTDPQGNSRLEGHKMTYPNDTTEIGSSYSINKSGGWTLKRTYTWKKSL
ncbi:hypothetical protein [Fulvivirga sp.]|uniref:hypothetical protein n=1 Tax=Fulvivirga sp. TaxID=1931237 RepID=UPI0032EF1B8A